MVNLLGKIMYFREAADTTPIKTFEQPPWRIVGLPSPLEAPFHSITNSANRWGEHAASLVFYHTPTPLSDRPFTSYMTYFQSNATNWFAFTRLSSPDTMQPRTNPKGSKWEAGLRKHIPWTAVSSLVVFVLCCVALAAVLSTSDGREVTTWPRPKQDIPVSVMLALAVNIANLCLSIALSKSYEIAWWLRALKGAELRRLQFDLDIQRHLSAMIGENTRIDSFAIAAMISFAVSVLDGPLIQRASSVTTTTFQPVDVDVQVNVMNTLLPTNFSGLEYLLDTGTFSAILRNISRAYAKREDIPLSINSCGKNTTCVFELQDQGSM